MCILYTSCIEPSSWLPIVISAKFGRARPNRRYQIILFYINTSRSYDINAIEGKYGIKYTEISANI